MAGPLAGLRVLDFTGSIPGPMATLYLADMGAEVLKILSASRYDVIMVQPPYLPGSKITANLAYLGRNKRSMVLNLKDQQAQEIVRKLIRHYDILIEQFRPGVMAGFGLDYETLRKANSMLIYCSITGYGQTGPLADKAGHDLNYIARSGIMSYSGRSGAGPAPPGMFIADAAGTANAIIGVLAAVIGRNVTGDGQHIDISMTDGTVVHNAIYAAGCLINGESPDYENMPYNGGTLYDYYETKDKKYMSVAPLEPQFYAAFYKAIGRPDLNSPAGLAPQNLGEIKKQIQDIFKTKTRDEWSAIFRTIDACVEPVLTIKEALEDEHNRQRGMVVEIDLPQGGKVKQPALPIKFSSYQPEYKKIGVAAGSHTKEILQELGYTGEQIAEMEKTGLFD